MVRFAPLKLRLIDSDWEHRVPSPAHDSLSPDQRAAYLRDHTDSYLGVTRGVDDRIDGQELTESQALAAGREALEALLTSGAFSEIRTDCFYVYRLKVDGWCQSGVVGGIHIEDYISGSLRIHEQIHDERAQFLARHSDVVGAQSSPVAVAHHPNATVTRIVEETALSEPLISFTMTDGLEQTVWEVNAEHNTAMRAALASASLYLIDGHHRTAAASLRHQSGASPWLLAAIFPTDQLKNSAFHRTCSGVDSDAFSRLSALPGARPGRIGDGVATVQIYHRDDWVTVPHSPAEGPLERLDTWQFEHLIRPLLGSNVSVRYQNAQGDEGALLDQVQRSGDLLALMSPVSMATLFAVADAGDVMPPKSTYFEPKVRSGIFLRHLDTEMGEDGGSQPPGRENERTEVIP